RTRGAPAAGAGAQAELPGALANRERAVDRVIHDRGAKFLRRLAAPQLRDAEAVFARRTRRRDTSGFGAGAEDVVQAHELVGARARLNSAGPTNDEWDAMPALVDVRLRAAEDVTRVVALLQQVGVVGLRRAAVVTGEDHKCVLGEMVLLKRREHLAGCEIRLRHEVGIGAEA